MEAENLKRGVVFIVFALVFSIILVAPLAHSGELVYDSGGTTIEVDQGVTFLIRHTLEWNEPENGAYSITIAWDCYDNHENENFTFVSASAYFTTGPNAGEYQQCDVIQFGPSPAGDNTRWTLAVGCPADNKDPRNGQFNVDIWMGAYGAGGVPHIVTDNHPIPFQFGGAIIVEKYPESWSRDPITIRVLGRGVSVTISPGENSGPPAQTLSYTVTVKNTSNVADNYALVASDDASWGLWLSENRFENVQPDENMPATLNVTIPENAVSSTDDNITVTVTGTGVSDNASCIAHAVAVPSPPEDDTTPPPSDTTPPPTPSLASPTNGASILDNTPHLDWSDVSDPSGVTYDLFIAKDAGFASIALQKTGLSASTYELTPVEALAAGTYYWRVRGVDGVGNVGSWSEKWSFTIYVPLAPATLTADTTPIKASVYVDNVLWGIAPQTRSLVAGSYTVSFGSYLGYLTPPPLPVTLAAGVTRILTVTYTEIPPELIENESPPVDIPSITTDENATIEVENTAITGMTIVVGENVKNVRITVQQLTDKPAEIAIGPPGVTYCYLNVVSENITDADIGIVLINFRVEKAWITAENVDPDSIVLRRWEPKLSGMWDPVAEVWVSLPTARIGEDDTYHYYQAESPGLSIFGIMGLTLAPPEFELSNLVINPSEVRPGEAVTISVFVTNVGDLEGTYTVTLKIDNVVEATENVTLAGGATETVTFTVSRDVEGTYDVGVDGLAGTFVVTLPASPIVPPLAITGGIVLSAGILIIWLRRRRTKKGAEP